MNINSDEIEKTLKKRWKTELALLDKQAAELVMKKAMAIERGSDVWKPIPFYHPEGTLVNGANKLYSLRTVLKHGGEFELCKAKGMSKGEFSFDDYVAMFDPDNPKPLTDPKQMQFRLPLSGYCNDDGIQPIRKVFVKKTAAATYDKGEKGPMVDGSCKITPLTI